jgi:hypothetical protein
MAKITVHIHFDVAAYTATATTTPPKPKFRLGDKVNFKSDQKGTVIVYHNSSPFKDLAAGDEVDVPTRTYTVSNIKRHHFDCGTRPTVPPTPPTKNGPPKLSQLSPNGFVPWGGGGNTPTGK